MKNLLLATSNIHKVNEIRDLLNGSFEVFSLIDVGYFDEIEETGITFQENALIKCQTIASSFPEYYIVSDDSGLSVNYLNGSPGVFSARYAGTNTTDEDNNDLVLKKMQGVQNREASFQCCLCLIIPKGKPQFFVGKVDGSIAVEKSGKNGFGYDSIFIPQGYNQTFGLLNSNIKQSISHRALAVNQLVEFLISI